MAGIGGIATTGRRCRQLPEGRPLCRRPIQVHPVASQFLMAWEGAASSGSNLCKHASDRGVSTLWITQLRVSSRPFRQEVAASSPCFELSGFCSQLLPCSFGAAPLPFMTALGRPAELSSCLSPSLSSYSPLLRVGRSNYSPIKISSALSV